MLLNALSRQRLEVDTESIRALGTLVYNCFLNAGKNDVLLNSQILPQFWKNYKHLINVS